MMRNRLVRTLSAVLLSLLLTGCYNDFLDEEKDEAVPMTFRATGDGRRLSQSQSAYTDQWDGTEEVAVSLGGAVKKYSVAEDGTLTPAVATDYFFWPHGTAQTVTAWFPYAEVKTPLDDLEPDQTADADYEASNLMEATATADFLEVFDLQFHHRTAKLTVVPQDYDRASTVTDGVGLTLGNVAVEKPHPNGDGSYSAFIAPRKLEAGQVLAVIAYDGNTFVYRLPDEQEFEAGRSYTYRLKFNTDANTLFVVTLNLTSFTYNGYQKKPEVSVRCNGRLLRKGVDYELKGDTVATVAGDYAITAEGIGEFLGTGSVTWKVDKASGTFSSIAAGLDLLTVGSTTSVSASKSGDGEVTYTSSNPAVATVEGTTITGVGSGTVTITGTIADGPNYTYGTRTRETSLTVVGKPATLAELKAWVNRGGEYNGSSYDFIGWYVDASGNISETDGGSSVGRIAYISTSAVDASFSDSRILVLATEDANGGTGCAWKSSAVSGESAYNNQNLLNGYAFTSAYGDNADYPAAYNAKHYGVSLAGISGASGWFLPSYRQWELMVKDNIEVTNSGASANKQGAAETISASYWVATESSSSATSACYYLYSRTTASGVKIVNQMTAQPKTNTPKVRTCFAY